MDSLSWPNKKNTKGKKVDYIVLNLSGPEAHA